MSTKKDRSYNDLYLYLNKSAEPCMKKHLDKDVHLVQDKQNFKHHNLIPIIPLAMLNYAQNKIKKHHT